MRETTGYRIARLEARAEIAETVVAILLAQRVRERPDCDEAAMLEAPNRMRDVIDEMGGSAPPEARKLLDDAFTALIGRSRALLEYHRARDRLASRPEASPPPE